MSLEIFTNNNSLKSTNMKKILNFTVFLMVAGIILRINGIHYYLITESIALIIIVIYFIKQFKKFSVITKKYPGKKLESSKMFYDPFPNLFPDKYEKINYSKKEILEGKKFESSSDRSSVVIFLVIWSIMVDFVIFMIYRANKPRISEETFYFYIRPSILLCFCQFLCLLHYS